MFSNSSSIERFRIAGPPGEMCGAFQFQFNGAWLRVIVSDGMDWDHVSVSLQHRCPTWEEMCYVKSLFFKPSETVVQYHPAKENYVNDHPFCLHLWRPQKAALPLPEKTMVGRYDGMPEDQRQQIEREMRQQSSGFTK